MSKEENLRNQKLKNLLLKGNYVTPEIIKKAEYMIRDNGGVVREDGSFSVKGVEGSYVFDENANMVKIRLTDKPWLASWEMIETEVRKFFA